MKKIIAMLLVLAMALSMFACASKEDTKDTTNTPSTTTGNDTPDTTDEQPATELTTITIPSYMVGENAGAVYFQPAVERFNEKYAGVYQIVLEEISEDDYFSQLSLLAQTGNLPLIVCGAPSTTADFVNNVLIPQNLYYPMKSCSPATCGGRTMNTTNPVPSTIRP